MKKLIFLFIGLGLGTLFFILGVFLKNHMLYENIMGIAGLISLFISGTSVGAFVSGDRVRVNYWQETKQNREERFTMAFQTALLGLTLLSSAIGIYIISYH